jgi:multiple sugar transport system permease protein
VKRTPIRPSTPAQWGLVYVLVIGGALIAVFPFVWALLASFKPPGEILTLHPRLLPQEPTLDNYREVLAGGSFARWYLNSFVVAGVVTASVCVFSSLAGYSLAKFRYAGRRILFLAILSTMMIPLEMLVIPWFLGAGKLGLVDSYAGIAFPGLVSAFGVFLMKQFMDSVPDALIESARIDGASEPAVFLKVVLPLVRPALAALAIFTFVGNWDSFLWPLIVTEASSMFTLPVGLQSFAGGQGIQYHLVLAAANLVVLPSLVVFAVLQRQIIEGVTLTGLKG